MIQIQKLATVAALLLAVWAYGSAGHTAPALAAEPRQAAITPDMVFMPVVVTDSKKAAVANLKPENFKVTEDGADQKVEYISAPGSHGPLGVILALSGNGPVKTPAQKDRISLDILASVKVFQDAGPAGSFAEPLPWDSDGIYKLVETSMDRLDKQADPRKALVVVSDGTISSLSSGNDLASKKLIDTAKKYQFPLYFLFVIPSRSNEPSLISDQGTYSVGYALQQVADATGGEVISAQPDFDLDHVSAQLRDKLKDRYVLGFTSNKKTKDGKWRKLSVKVTPPAGVSGLKVTGLRSKYFVPKG